MAPVSLGSRGWAARGMVLRFCYGVLIMARNGLRGRRWIALLPTVIALSGCGHSAEVEDIVRLDKQLFLKDIQSDNPKVRYDAWTSAQKVGPDVIVRLGIL